MSGLLDYQAPYVPRIGSDTKPVARFAPLQLSELLKADVPAVPWLVEGLVPEGGITIFSGYPGCGKSWTVLHLLCCVATGAPLFGHFTTKRCNGIFLVDEEDSEIQKLRRLKDMGITDLPDATLLQSYTGFKATDKIAADELLDLCRRESVDVLIFDSLVRISTGDENSASDMAKVFESLRQRFCKNGITVVLVHHERKPGRDQHSGSLMSMRGSSDIAGSADSQVSIRKEDRELTYTPGKLRQAEALKPFTVRLESAGGLVSLDYVSSLQDSSPYLLAEAISVFLSDHGPANRGSVIKAVREATGISEERIAKQLDYLVKTEPAFIEQRGDNNARIYSLLDGEDHGAV